jgi:hypothetical protein
MSGGYNRRRLQVTGDIRYREVPEKNKYSHVCEALEYDCVSGGEDRMVMTTPEQRARPREQYAGSDYDELNH